MPPASANQDGNAHSLPDLLDPADIDSFRNDPRLPELARLSVKQRQYVWKHCAQPCLSRRRIIVHGLVCTGIAAMVGLALQLTLGLGEAVGGLIIGGALAFHNHFWLAHCRRRIRAFIRNNATALAAAENQSWLRLPANARPAANSQKPTAAKNQPQPTPPEHRPA